MDGLTYPLLISSGALLGFAAGVGMHRSDFCIAGMFRDLFIFRRLGMVRFLLLLVCVSMALFETARLVGLLPLYPFPLLGPPSLANVVGGFLFGAGMVLAGGCVVGTLVRMGSGSLLSLLAFVGLIAGSAAYAGIHPLWATFVSATRLGNGAMTIPQMLGVNPVSLVMAVCAVGLYFLQGWYRAGELHRPSAAEGYLQPWKAALLLSLVGLASCLLTGMPLGVTTTYAKIGAYLESLLLGDHLQGLPYFETLPLDYLHPLTHARLQGGPGPRPDAVSAIQLPLILGVIGGAAVSAVQLGEWRVYYRVPPRQYLSALVGGFVMGMAARMAPACNVWHLMGGLPILAGQSLLFVAGLVPGAWLGSRLLVRLVLKIPHPSSGHL